MKIKPKDRSLVARMGGNIAGGIVSREPLVDAHEAACRAVRVAIHILDEINANLEEPDHR